MNINDTNDAGNEKRGKRKKPVVISFVNNKGGSAKTTTCANVGYSLSKLGYRVLLVDGDMQSNLSLSFLEEDRVLEVSQSDRNLFYALKNRSGLKGFIVGTPFCNIDIILPAVTVHRDNYPGFSEDGGAGILRECMKDILTSGDYDYILIDSPPTLGDWVLNIMNASDFLIIPAEASPWCFFGLANLLEYVGKAVDPGRSEIMGVVLTKVDERKRYLKQARETIGGLKGLHVFNCCIHMDSSVEWAQEFSKPIMEYRKTSRAAREYFELSKEVDLIAGRKGKH